MKTELLRVAKRSILKAVVEIEEAVGPVPGYPATIKLAQALNEIDKMISSMEGE